MLFVNNNILYDEMYMVNPLICAGRLLYISFWGGSLKEERGCLKEGGGA